MKSLGLRKLFAQPRSGWRSLACALGGGLALLGLALAGCQQSEAWRTVVEAKIPGAGQYSQSRKYAMALRDVLEAKKIESKVVTFRYVVPTRPTPVIRMRSAVFYRDMATPENPWWLAGNFRSTPVWLPNAPVAEQLRFLVRRPVDIVEIDDHLARPEKWATQEDLVEFRRRHGTAFDPFSSLDREKMAVIRREEPAPAPAKPRFR